MSSLKLIQPRVYNFTDQLFFSEQVNIYLIQSTEKIILIDIPTYSFATEKILKKFNKPIIAILTHGPTGIADVELWRKKIDIQILLHADDQSNPWLKISPDILITTQEYHISETIKVIHCKGHTPGSVCILDVYSRCLFTGDTIQGNMDSQIVSFLDKNTSSPEEDTTLRFQSCIELLKYSFESIMPFHYFPILSNAHTLLSQFVESNKNKVL